VAESRLNVSLKSRVLSVKVWQALRAEAVYPFSPRIREILAHQTATAPGMPPLIGLMALRQALAQAPDSPLLRIKLVLVRLAYGDRRGARESAEDFARRFPKLPEARQLLDLTAGKARP